MREATVSGSGGVEEFPLKRSIDSTFGGNRGSFSCENIVASATWLERKWE